MNSRDGSFSPGVRIFTRRPPPALSCLSHGTLRCPPPPPARSRQAAAQALHSPPLRPAASAPRSHRSGFQPRRCRPAQPRAAFAMAITPALPTPTLLSAGRAAVRTQPGPMTHGRAASARALEPELELGRRPPSPRDLLGSAEDCRNRRREGEGPGLRGPRTHQANGNRSRCHCCGEPFACSPVRYFSRTPPQEPASPSAVLTRPRSPPSRTQQRDPAQPAFALRLRAGLGPRACARSAALLQRLPGSVVFQPPFCETSSG